MHFIIWFIYIYSAFCCKFAFIQIMVNQLLNYYFWSKGQSTLDRSSWGYNSGAHLCFVCKMHSVWCQALLLMSASPHPSSPAPDSLTADQLPHSHSMKSPELPGWLHKLNSVCVIQKDQPYNPKDPMLFWNMQGLGKGIKPIRHQS